MAAAAPIVVQEKLLLTSLGVAPEFISFKHTTMESDKYVCVRETGAQNTVVIADLSQPSAPPARRPITADSAVMCPDKKVIALRAASPAGTPGDALQVFNLDTKTKLKAFSIAETVEFWKWVSPTMLGLVTPTAVYHWDVSSGPVDAPPVKVFDRTANLQGAQIISYRVSSDGKWCVLVGITPGSAERPALAKGAMQLFSVEQAKSQPLEAHAAAFATCRFSGRAPELPASTVIAFAQKTVREGGAVASKLHVIELGTPPAGAGAAPQKRQAELFFPAEFADDFPVSLQVSERYGLVYVVTKLGLLFVYDLETATAVYRNRISPDPIFLASASDSTGGLLAINRRGQVLLATVNEPAVVPFVAQQLGNLDLAMAMAKRGGLPGAEGLAGQQFERLAAEGKWKEAAEAAAESPQGSLRTPATLERLRAATAAPGQKPPILVYLGLLLARGKLNAPESAELARLTMRQGRKELLLGWWRDGKLEAGEELGDLLAQAGDKDAALKCYQACGASGKVIVALAESGDAAALQAFTGQTGQRLDYLALLQQLMMTNPSGAVSLAKMAVKQQPPAADANAIADLFLQRNMVREATAFLLDYLSADRAQDSALQTKLLEVNLVTNPQVADAVLANGQLTHYDRPRVAQLCEKAGLYLRALQHYTDLKDIRRCVVNTHALDPQALTEWFGSLSAEWGLECLKELLVANPQGNLQLVVSIAREYSEQLTPSRVVALLEQQQSFPGLYLYLGSRLAASEDPEEHYKYIEAAARTGQLKEVERVTRESAHYPPERVKNFLMEAKLPDARPLINVCDKHNLVPDLTHYLYSNGLLRYIEGYVQKVAPAKCPLVVGALLDAEAPDDFITALVLSVRSLVPVDELVAEVEKRNRLKLLTPILEQLIGEGSTDPHVHDALGKIVVDTNNNPEHFMQTNPYYNPLVVGKYAEKRDPTLACAAYKRGKCDDALVDCTTRHSLFKLQARYVVERGDAELWDKVLSEDTPARRGLIDQVVSTALPESRAPEQVSAAVKAFLKRDLQSELIELLEKIVLGAGAGGAFASNANLQNLLILTAVKADKSRVKDYVNRLDNFDGVAVAEKAIEYGLYEEAFEIFRKIGRKVEAVRVLLRQGGAEGASEITAEGVARAHEFASKVDEPPVWSELAAAHLERRETADAIAAYLRAQDASAYAAVIDAVRAAAPPSTSGAPADPAAASAYADLVRYLQMARKRARDPKVDTELVYALARTNALGELDAFVHGQHSANVAQAADRCFDESLFEAARALYAHIPNWGRLASTLVRLHRFQEAVDAARKANAPKTWKEVCFACVEEGEGKLAQLCGLHIVVNADELDEVSEFYQRRGKFDELIALLEAGIGLERAHMGVFTELGLMYAAHRPEKLMEHLKLFAKRLNIPRLLRCCEQNALWRELAHLYAAYDEHDNAAAVMMAHPSAWEHVAMKDVVVRVSNVDVLYRAIAFYLEQHPDLLHDLMRCCEGRLDHGRAVALFRKSGQLPLAKDYLLNVQKSNANLLEVNEAVNDLLLDEEDFAALRDSITRHDNFDQVALAARLEKHELLEMRRLAALVYKRNLRWRKAVELAKADGLFKDAIETVAASGQPELAEELLRWFVAKGEKECFAAALYTCYDLLRPDIVLELAWAHGLERWAMPFFVTMLKEYTSKVDTLMAERKEAREAVEQAQGAHKAAAAAVAAMMPLALPAAPGGGVGGAPMPPPYGAPPPHGGGF